MGHPSCHQMESICLPRTQISSRSRMQNVYSRCIARCNNGRTQTFSLDRIHNSGAWGAWLWRQAWGRKWPGRGWEHAHRRTKTMHFLQSREEGRPGWAAWRRLGCPERFMGPLRRPIIYGRSQPSWKLQGICLEAQYCLILTGFQNQDSVHHHPGASAILDPEISFQLFLPINKFELLGDIRFKIITVIPYVTIHKAHRACEFSCSLSIFHPWGKNAKIEEVIWRDLNLTVAKLGLHSRLWVLDTVIFSLWVAATVSRIVWSLRIQEGDLRADSMCPPSTQVVQRDTLPQPKGWARHSARYEK